MIRNKVFKLFFLIFISIIISFLTYKFCYFLAEKFFFDKFFYYKNIDYGYLIPNKHLSFSDFGDRAKDINNLQNGINIKTDDKKYNIAIFGDSLTWGQGITNNQRFTVLLEKRLNKIKPTKIYSFANCGDNLFDHYIKYQKSLSVYGKMDLYIFAFYNNDLVFNTDKHYNTDQFLTELTKNCSGNTIYDPEYNSNNPNQGDQFIESKKSSLDHNSVNYCAYQGILPLLPKDKVIYINLGSLFEKWDVETTFSNTINHDLNIIKTSYLTLCDTPLKCNVSDKDRHPSTFVNKYYTDILFNEITTNNKLNFKQKPLK
jgi:lysophospholipase L1-like esterase